MAAINYARIVECAETEGPGKRFAVWAQGCLRRCPGCCNPAMFALEEKNFGDCDDVFDLILKSRERNGIEGVTFLGGEPFLQAKGLSHIARRCREAGLSVMVFSGYTLEELTGSGGEPPPDMSAELLANTDLLVDGPFVRELPDGERNWTGSSNQRFHYLTSFYGPEIELDPLYRTGFELLIKEGVIMTNGWPVELIVK